MRNDSRGSHGVREGFASGSRHRPPFGEGTCGFYCCFGFRSGLATSNRSVVRVY